MNSTYIKRFWQKQIRLMGVLLSFSILMANPIAAKDTDIYKVSAKQNCYILMDSSGSMAWAVYESNVDYGEFFDYLFELNESGSPYNTYIYDTVTYSDYFHNNHFERQKIYLLLGKGAGLSAKVIDSEIVSFTGDTGHPSIDWDIGNLVDTHTLIDADGNLSGDGVGTQRITTAADGTVLLDGGKLPLGQSVNLHSITTLYDGSQMDVGFGGLLHAPGTYFSGYEGVTVGSLNEAESGDSDLYFFVTGNWVNMQSVFNLHYTTNNPTPGGAFKGDSAWPYEGFPLDSEEDWRTQAYYYDYPAGTANYANRLRATSNQHTIEHPGAQQIQVHFSLLDVLNRDYVIIYNAAGKQVASYNNNNPPPGGWSVIVPGDTIKIGLSSSRIDNAKGYTIDAIRVNYAEVNTQTMQSRLDVAKDAMRYVVDAFHGKMNWGFASFANGDGAQINSALNPNDTDDANRAAILQHIDGVSAGGGTPLGEALQDVFEDGYYGKRNSLDNLSCRRNYIISMTDGYPSADDGWSRIGGVTFKDWDGDGWTQDPVQYSSPGPDYYDDVAHWIYTHSWRDKSEVIDPANSYVNVTTHHIAFGAEHPLLKDAAGESGGMYITAYNKTQLVAAFYALGLQITEAISFTAPVVSVDAANKIQNGDDLYLGLFLPQDSHGWVGNVKKFKLGDGSAARPSLWMLYDNADTPAITDEGIFLDNGSGFWGDDSDPNDFDNYGNQDVQEDGVGEVLTERVVANFASATYYERPIYTYIGGALTQFDPTNITAADLSVADDATRNKVVNYVHGYTYDANDGVADPTAEGDPLATRDWALGSIVHSSPVVVDYYDPADIKTLLDRYIVVGANDGMLHVFNDSDGSELLAFIPEEALPNLQFLSTTPLVETVDGNIALYRSNKNPKYIIFGLRRGGGGYWCLDVSDRNPLNWTVQWHYTHPEIIQSWAEPQIAAIPVGLDSSTGAVTFQDAVIFSGGYDPEEDSYPEPFLDEDDNGSPYSDAGNLDPAEWKKTNADQDLNGNGLYDRYNPDQNEFGRGIFVVDIDDPTKVHSISGNQVLPFSVTYDTVDITSGATQTLTDMKWCFPATPSVVASTYDYIFEDSGTTTEGYRNNVLQAIYVPDIYTNLYKVNFQFDVEISGSSYALTDYGWQVSRIFSGNPGSTSTSGSFSGIADTDDQGRKAFYSPAVSWGGACDYFDAGNYGYVDVRFDGQYDIASLYMGTGDREHPGYNLIRDRFYAVYDDTTVTAEKISSGTSVTVSTTPYGEEDLLNLTCDELDEDSGASDATKASLQTILTDDVAVSGSGTLENGTEDDAKGWYIVLEDQGSCSGSIDTATTEGRDNHEGEKVLSSVGLYAGALYFTSYQPSVSDPCNPQGNGFAYALNYCDATAAYNNNPDNDGTTDSTLDVSDRYIKINTIYGVPSEFAIVTREGQAGAMAMMGGKIIGPRDDDDGGDDDDDDDDSDFRIRSPGWGLELFYWREGNSLED